MDFGLWTLDFGLTHALAYLRPAILGRRSIPLLVGVFFHVGKYRREFPERLHPSDAARAEHRFSAVALSSLQLFHSLVSQHSAHHLALSARQMPKLRRADFHPLLPG